MSAQNTHDSVFGYRVCTVKTVRIESTNEYSICARSLTSRSWYMSMLECIYMLFIYIYMHMNVNMGESEWRVWFSVCVSV